MARFVVLGTDPPAPYTKFVHTMLMEAMAEKWPTYCLDPPIANAENDNHGVTMWDVEPPNQNEIEVWFETIADMRDPNSRPLGWNRVPILHAIMIHVYCKGDSMEHSPTYMPTVVNTIEDIIEVERKALIPHSHYVTMTRAMEVPKLTSGEQRYATSCMVSVSYTKVVV